MTRILREIDCHVYIHRHVYSAMTRVPNPFSVFMETLLITFFSAAVFSTINAILVDIFGISNVVVRSLRK